MTTDRAPRRPAATVAMTVAVAAIVAASAAAIYAERGTMRRGVHSLRGAHAGWIVLGVVLESASMAAFALLQRRMLKAARTDLSFTTLLATAYTSNALAVGVPVVGSGVAAAATMRQFRSHGADPAAVSLALALAGVVSTVAFALVAAIGALATGNPTGSLIGLITAVGSVAIIAALIVAVRSPKGRARVETVVVAILRRVQRVLDRPAGDVRAMVRATTERILSLELRPATIASAFCFGVGNWACDALCLAVAIPAVGATIPWQKIVLVWTAGTGAGSLSPTPFGLGVVDIALIGGLSAAGLTSSDAIGAVLLYRIITFKILVTLLWIAYRYLIERHRLVRPAAPDGFD